MIQKQLSFTIMTDIKDWRLIWLHTWNSGWDFRLGCFCFRSESVRNHNA